MNKTVPSRDGKKEDRKEEVTEVSMKLCLVFVSQEVILWSLSMKDINKNYFLGINAGAIERPVRSKFQLATRQTR